MTARAGTADPEDVRVVDSHIHVWTPNDDRYPMAVHPHHYPPWHGDTSEYLAEMTAAGVDQAVIVQIAHHGGDHSYALAARDAHPDRFAVVGLLDTARPDAPQAVEQLVRSHGVQGIRVVSRRPEQRGLRDLEALWGRAAELAIPVALYLSPDQLAHVDGIARRHADLTILIDHVGHPDTISPPFAMLADLFRLARRPRVYVKTSHLYCVGRAAEQEEHIPDLLDRLRDSFGAERMLFGSNWPLVRETGGLSRCVAGFRAAIAHWPAADQRAVLATTAHSVYRWKDQ